MTDSAVTVRMPANLRRKLEERARRQHRSLSRQIVAELEATLEPTAPDLLAARPRLLGMFKGLGPVPSEKDFRDLDVSVKRGVQRRLRNTARMLAE